MKEVDGDLFLSYSIKCSNINFRSFSTEIEILFDVRKYFRSNRDCTGEIEGGRVWLVLGSKDKKMFVQYLSIKVLSKHIKTY